MKSGLFYILIPITLGACTCRNTDCPATAKFTFRVIDSGGSSLFPNIGFSKIFNSDSMQIVGIGDRLSSNSLILIQEGVEFQFQPSPTFNQYLIKYSFAPSDTLHFDLNTYSSECCNLTVDDYQVSLNSQNEKSPYDESSVIVIVK